MPGLQKPPALPPQKKLQSLKTTVASARKSPVGTAVIAMISVQTILGKVQNNARMPKNQKKSPSRLRMSLMLLILNPDCPTLVHRACPKKSRTCILTYWWGKTQGILHRYQHSLLNSILISVGPCRIKSALCSNISVVNKTSKQRSNAVHGIPARCGQNVCWRLQLHIKCSYAILRGTDATSIASVNSTVTCMFINIKKNVLICFSGVFQGLFDAH